MKKCTKCFVDKEITEFNKNSKTKDGRREICKSCQNEYNKKYYNSNKDYYKKYKMKWSSNNIDYMRDYYNSNKERIKIYNKQYYQKNRDFILNNCTNYYYINREKIIERISKYYQNNRTSLNEYQKDYKKIQYKKFPYLFAHRNILKRHLSYVNIVKSDRTTNLLGYTSIELKEHIESLFTDGMSWENYGEWHIDHKKPLSKFDKNVHTSIVNSLNNLQPLWAIDNLKKSNKYE